MFADHTGGWTVTLTHEPWRRVPAMFHENEAYYMLGITPSAVPARSGLHRLRVTVNRPGVTVRVRSGYYDPQREPGSVTNAPLTTLDRATSKPTQPPSLPLSVTAAAFRISGTDRAAVAVAGGVDRMKLQSDAETMEVAVRAFDERSPRRNSKGLWTSTIQLRSRDASDEAVHYDTLTRLDLPPGSYDVQLSVRRTSDNVAGTVSTSIVVPDFARERLSVSGIILGRLPQSALTRGEPMADVLPFAPTTRRAFAPAEIVPVLLRLYQGGKGTPKSVSVTVRVVNERDDTVFGTTNDVEPASFGGGTREAEFQMRLPVARLESGEYLMTIAATLENRTVSARPIRFRVRPS
jgi:hypothetical protein